ncbi:MAG: efflux RND transporter periplasmic adaptor subunit [Polaromonas sp.]|nr:efflux RND transporter periplasmic adaptor subunit [Polaromonas sp.]
MRIKATFKWGWVLVSVGALMACSRPAPSAEPIRSVKVITVGTQAPESALEYAGEVRARVELRLGFRVGGKLLDRPVEPGEHVRAGQLLARLDPQDLKLAADAARAQLAAARTNHALAVADFKRYQALKDKDFISGAELERRDAVVQAARAQLEQAQAQLSVQGNQATYASLHADVAGVVTAVLAERGQVVAAGAPVVQVAQDGVRDVVFSVPEDKVASIRLGTEVQVRRWSMPGALKGLVREVAASADPATRTFAVKVAVQTKDALPLGSTVSVWPTALRLPGLAVIKLPTSALRQEGQTTAVWVLDNTSMTVKSQVVQVATADGNDVVVTGGLQPGMQVVVAGVHVLAPGQKVMIYRANGAP